MLPTTGFFKNIDCPYYENSCDRPYCHFKHRKKSQEPSEPSPASAPAEIPTYNPTPKSQLANSRSHIPISYVPDLAIRKERNNLRSISSYGYGDKPTYNPTPLSILSTGKVNSSKSSENSPVKKSYSYSETSHEQTNLEPETAKYSPETVKYSPETAKYSPETAKYSPETAKYSPETAKYSPETAKYSSTFLPEISNDINFEDLETEFDMIDEIISDSGAADTANGESESTEDEKFSKSKLKHQNHSKPNDKVKVDKKQNGRVSESSNKSKSDSKSKSRSHSTKKETSKLESRHKKDNKSSISSSKDDKKRSSKSLGKKNEPKEKKQEPKEKKQEPKEKKQEPKEKKQEPKDKHSSRHKENSSEKDKHKHKSKERDKRKKSSEKDKKKHKDKESGNKKENNKTKKDGKLKEASNDTIKPYPSGNFDEDCDIFSNDYDNYEEDSDLGEDTLEECYKIFTEYKPTEPDIFAGITIEDHQEPHNEEEKITLSSKKRIAHENVNQTQTKVMFNKPKPASNPAQAMVNRLKAARLAQANNEQNNIINEMNRYILKRPSEAPANDHKKLQKVSTNIAKPSTSTSLIDEIISGKPTNVKPRRIAPVQNVNSIQRAKAKIEEMAKMRAVNAIVKTSTQSISKGAKRVAHVPEASVVDIPDVLEADHSKLPVNVRSRFLKMIVDECSKLYLSTEEAHQRALNEEFKCYERCAALVTYRNSAMLAINRLRKELQEREMAGLGPILPGEAPTASKDNKCEFRGSKFYENIKRYILNDEELVLHGFPREGTTPGRATVKTQKKVSKGYLGDDDRICCRCSKLYKVDKDGFSLYAEECLYHPLKKRTFRGESIYLCCKTSEGLGCVTSTTHVSEGITSNESEIEGYQTTMPPEDEEDPRSYEVFALDCEMCYTTKGLELTRVTIVNSECKTVYESLVKPLNSIIDYNTRFSGITEEQMNRTATSILQVQANILHLCNSNTILIGHSLESDMKALKIIHSSIIDTSVLFPHKFGLPHKRALRDLAREFLKKIIQNDVSGHDSAEDALTCMELVQWKLKEELKVRGVKV